MDVEPIDNANCILIGKEADFVKAVIRVRAAAFRAVSHLSLYPDNPPFTHPVIRKSCALRPESLDHERGIHGSLQADPDGFGAGFAIALAAQETTQ
jgi:hypothetical protein